MHTRQKGFTLIELMIVVAIIGILAAIAVPSYGKYVRDARRTDGHIALRSIAQQMERCRTKKFSYAHAECKLTPDPTPSEEGHYTVKLSGESTVKFKLTATPVAGGPQASDTECNDMAITETGATTPEECW